MARLNIARTERKKISGGLDGRKGLVTTDKEISESKRKYSIVFVTKRKCQSSS